MLSVRPAFVASFLKKLLRVKREVVVTTNGSFFVDPVSHLGNSLITQSSYEPCMTEALSSILRESDVFLDVGANEGYFSVIASKLVCESGLVLSIEPQSRLQEVIFRNIAENSSLNIRVFQLAISDKCGIANISLLPDVNTGGSGLFRVTRYTVPTQIVPQVTLNEFISLFSIKKIRLMKIDVESFEYEAILGSKELFAAGLIEHIALELHPQILAARGKSAREIVEFLEACGYKKNRDFETLIMSKYC